MESATAALLLEIKKLGSKLDDVLHKYSFACDEDKSGCDDLLSDVKALTETLEQVTAVTDDKSSTAIPVKVFEELRVFGSACWNMTVRHVNRQDSHKAYELRASLREFATKAFLIGNYAYTTTHISHSYFTNHPREAEQCVLMCLKTARDLSLCDMGSSAKKLLFVGEKVASFIRPGVHDSLANIKYRNMGWEFTYTTMDVTWNLGDYQESCCAAEKLVQMLQKDNTLLRNHREAFFRFVFNVGNASVPLNEERHIRVLLQCSIDVQTHLKETGANEPPHHLTVLYGVTVEQMALSWLREGQAAEAVRWAIEADTALHSNTSALLRLKSVAEAKMEEEAVMLLHQYVQRADVVVDDAVAACFELHKVLVSKKQGSIDALRLLCRRIRGGTLSEVVLFRFVQLLLHDGGLISCKEALRVLQKECVDFEDAKYRRYCFMWLWELSDIAEFTQTEVLESLEASLYFKDCASEDEVDSVHLRLCAEYIAGYEERKEHNSMLINAKNILLNYIGRKPRCAFAHCLLFKIAVLQCNTVELEKELSSLLTCEPAELVMPALCTVINYCLNRGYSHGVALTAARAVFSSAPVSDTQTELQLLRVYVTTLLNKTCSSTEEELVALSQRFHRLILDKNVIIPLSHDDTMWWAQAFLLLGFDFAGGPGPASISSFRAATLIMLQDPAQEESSLRAFLLAALLCFLEDEFQMFAAGRPLVDTQELSERLRVCKDVLMTTADTSFRATLLFSEAECCFRQPSTDTPERIQMIVDELSTMQLDFEEYEALADGASFVATQFASEHPCLNGVALKLYMRAATIVMDVLRSFQHIATSDNCEGDGSCVIASGGGNDDDNKTERYMGFIMGALSCLYKAFTLAFDRTEQLAVVQQLMELLSLDFDGVTVVLFIKRYHADAPRAAVSHTMSLVLLFLEYFTVEAWNNSVFYLHLTDAVKQTEWANVAWTLVNTLPEMNSVASALLSLKAIKSL